MLSSRSFVATLVTMLVLTDNANSLPIVEKTGVSADCVPLGSTASPWDAVISCKDWYGVFVNGDGAILENPSTSIKLTSAATTSLEDCASTCFLTKKCQWFKVQTNTCTLYQDLVLSPQSTARSTSTAQYGFLFSGEPDFLNQNLVKNATFQLGGRMFYRTTDLATSKSISMYIGDSATTTKSPTCAAAPLTLYRSFAMYFQTSSMISGVASGAIFNSMDGKFTREVYLQALKQPKGNLTEVVMPTDAVDIDAKGNVVRTGKPGSTYTYRLDSFGRIAEVSAHMSYTNILKKAGRKGTNPSGVTTRAQYCFPAYQTRYNVIQHLTDATSAWMAFQAGHLIGCQFSNPNSFFNFVPQNVNSNAKNGCWYNTELTTSKFLKMGCEGDLRVRNTYFSEPGVLDEVTRYTGPLMSPTEASALYTNKGNDPTLLVHRPCGFWYRPIKMSIDFTITGGSLDSQCRIPQAALAATGGKIFKVDPKVGSMQLTRAFAEWSFETTTFNRLRGMATTDYRNNQCYAETGKSVSMMTFTNDFDQVVLKAKDLNTTTDTPMCLTVVTKVLQVVACDNVTETSASRWSAADASPLLALVNSAKFSCIALSGSPSTCLSLRFQYTKPIVSFDGQKSNIFTRDELVDGQIIVGTKCLVVNSKSLALSLAATTSATCSTFQATYTLDPTETEDDGGD